MLGNCVTEHIAGLAEPIDAVADRSGSSDVPPWALARRRPRGLLLSAVGKAVIVVKPDIARGGAWTS